MADLFGFTLLPSVIFHVLYGIINSVMSPPLPPAIRTHHRALRVERPAAGRATDHREPRQRVQETHRNLKRLQKEGGHASVGSSPPP